MRYHGDTTATSIAHAGAAADVFLPAGVGVNRTASGDWYFYYISFYLELYMAAVEWMDSERDGARVEVIVYPLDGRDGTAAARSGPQVCQAVG